MSIDSSLQQIAGGVAAAAAGMIVKLKTEFSPLEHYNTVSYVMVCITLLSVFLLYRVSVMVKKKLAESFSCWTSFSSLILHRCGRALVLIVVLRQV